MKKCIFISLFLLLSLSLFSINITNVGIVYNYSKLSFEEYGFEGSYSISSIGINLSSYAGGTIGFLVEGNFFFPVSFDVLVETSTYAVDLSVYSLPFGMDAIIGAGTPIKIGSNMEILAGGGLHINEFMFNHENSLQSIIWINFGIGFVGKLAYYISDGIGINIGLSGGYDFVMIISTPEGLSSEFQGGFGISPSAGITIKY